VAKSRREEARTRSFAALGFPRCAFVEGGSDYSLDYTAVNNRAGRGLRQLAAGQAVAAYNPTMEDRIVELESRVAFQDQTIRSLDDVIRRFSSRVERLEKRVSELIDALQAGGEEVGPHDERPPHY